MNFKTIIRSIIIYSILIALYSIGLYKTSLNNYIFSIYEHMCILLALVPLLFAESSNLIKYHVNSRNDYLNFLLRNNLFYAVIFWFAVIIIKLFAILINNININIMLYIIHSMLLLYEIFILILIFTFIFLLPNKKNREILKYIYIALTFICLFTGNKFTLILNPILLSTIYFSINKLWILINFITSLFIVLILYSFIEKGDYSD